MTQEKQTYAVIRSGGKQYTVRPGERVRIDKIEGEEGSSVVFDQVLVISNDAGVQVGAPLVAGATVTGKLVSTTKDKKINVFKRKKRKGFTWSKGHRQQRTNVLIETI